MILKITNVFCHLLPEDDLEIHSIAVNKLREYLSVENENYFFKRKYNRYISDRLYFCSTAGKFPSGFFPNVYKYLKSEFAGTPIKLVDYRNNLRYFAEKLDIDLGLWDLRDNQRNALVNCNNVIEGVYWPRGIINAATNAGKNSIIAGIHKNIIDGNTLLLIHSKDIKNQAVDFFSTLFDVGQIHGDKCEIDKPFVVGMYKTIYNRLQDDFRLINYLNNVTTLIVDECHRASSREYIKLISSIDAGQRYFFSGTPLEMADKGSKMRLLGFSGMELYKITNQELIDNGYSNKISIKIYLNRFEIFDNVQEYKYLYDKFIMYSENRLGIIQDYISENADRQIIISVDFLEHGYFLIHNLKGDGIVFLHSGTENREGIINDFKNKKIRILVTTLLQEGINAPIDTLIFAQGGKSNIAVKQYVGRILRKSGNYEVSEVLDFYDDFKYLRNHSKKRLDVYRKEYGNILFHYDNDRGIPKV